MAALPRWVGLAAIFLLTVCGDGRIGHGVARVLRPLRGRSMRTASTSSAAIARHRRVLGAVLPEAAARSHGEPIAAGPAARAARPAAAGACARRGRRVARDRVVERQRPLVAVLQGHGRLPDGAASRRRHPDARHAHDLANNIPHQTAYRVATLRTSSPSTSSRTGTSPGRPTTCSSSAPATATTSRSRWPREPSTSTPSRSTP